MSWKGKVVALYKQFGAPVKFAAKMILGAVLPGGSAVAELVSQALECAHETAKDHFELDERKAPAATAADLQRLESVLEVLAGDMAALMEQVVRLQAQPEEARRELQAALAAMDDRSRTALIRLDGLARSFDRLEEQNARIEQAVAALREELREVTSRNRIHPGDASPRLVVSINDQREHAVLRRLRDEFRKLPAEYQNADDLMLLADGLSAAGLFGLARDGHADAARAAARAADTAREAEAHFKAYRDACEQGRWDDALASVRRAAELDPARFEPFPLRRYEPQRILGAGGFGTVVLCRDLYSKRCEVAVKALHTADLARDVDEVFGEAQTLHDLQHPSIIRVRNWDFADVARTRPYIVMDYFAGDNLQVYLDRHGPLAPDDLLAVARRVAEATQAAHARGVLHRDLKPDNVLVRKREGGWEVKIIDFGLAVRRQAVSTSVAKEVGRRTAQDRSFAGTFKYAPPEQKGELAAEVGPYSDVYTFGKTCCEALFGTTEPKRRQWATVPEALAEVLEQCIEQGLERRHASFEPVLDELEVLAQEAATPEIGRPGVSPPSRFIGREDSTRTTHAPPQTEIAPRQVNPPKPRRQPGEIFTNSIGMKLAWIPAGKFRMGSPPDEKGRMRDEGPPHEVEITQSFYLGVTVVTQAEYEHVAGKNPSWFFKEGGGKDKVKGVDTRRFPVETVSWDEAMTFCNELNKRDEKKPMGWGYGLPTEAEWEYACRAGTATVYFFGDQPQQLGEYAWHDSNSDKRTHEVGGKKPNPWGLLDVYGNVYEWCIDLHSYYPDRSVQDPAGPEYGTKRIVRGGSWVFNPMSCRSAGRYALDPGVCINSVGFRVVLRPVAMPS
jgi:formylglycine-generating enzyme required for sulfatase activity/tetratricopeptide (TPR) repeat protein